MRCNGPLNAMQDRTSTLKEESSSSATTDKKSDEQDIGVHDPEDRTVAFCIRSLVGPMDLAVVRLDRRDSILVTERQPGDHGSGDSTPSSSLLDIGGQCRVTSEGAGVSLSDGSSFGDPFAATFLDETTEGKAATLASL